MRMRIWVLLILCCSTAAIGAQDANKPPDPKAPHIVFIKEFPKSFPDYFSITLTADGHGIYATAPDDNQPVEFQLPPQLSAQVFEAAARLGYFKNITETTRKIAFMGKKTLRYESGSERQESSFNYTDNADVMAVAEVFEKISATEQHFLNLERLIRFDRLGVMQELLQVEIAMNSHNLVAPEQLAPLLEKISGDRRFMNIAREHADVLLARIHKGDYSPNINLTPVTKP